MKRAFDIVAALVALIVLLPLQLVTALIVRAHLGRPVLFRQTRIGRGGEPFTIHKFRTMRDARDANGRLIPDAERLTNIGRLLRRLSLDELPELWNILRGEMSVVGPRPLLPEYMSLYSPEQHRRHEVRPGLTGWAQVNGRNSLTWEDRFKLDVWYVDHQSFLLDLKIIFLTIFHVFHGGGISHAGHATMEPFRGSRSS